MSKQDRPIPADPDRVNVYTCPKCGGYTVTIDVHYGVTPFLLRCRASGKEGDCDGMAVSSLYPKGRPIPACIPAPSWEWFKPVGSEYRKLNPAMREHVNKGGLDIRRRASATSKPPDGGDPWEVPLRINGTCPTCKRRLSLVMTKSQQGENLSAVYCSACEAHVIPTWDPSPAPPLRPVYGTALVSTLDVAEAVEEPHASATSKEPIQSHSEGTAPSVDRSKA